jgi:hypothetical protein
MKSNLILAILFLFLVNPLASQKRINRETWRELRDGIHYKKKEAGGKAEYFENWSEEFNKRRKRDFLNSKQRKPDFMKDKNKSQKSSSGSSWNIPEWTIYLAYILVGLVLVFIIYQLFFKNPMRTNKKVESVIQEELPIEKPVSELERLLSKFIQEGNYREAVRIYFIFIIKALREKGWIQWEKKKTNTAYLFELRNRKQYPSFSQATLIFEIIWYGDRMIDEAQFKLIRPQFEELLKSIQSENE